MCIRDRPLTAQYEHYLVNENVRHVLIDAGALANSGFVDLDALVNVRGTWERRKGARGVLEFCRDNERDDIQELYLIVINHDRQPNGKVSGTYDVTMRASCPAGWSGWIKYVETIDEETYELVAGEDVYTISKHKRIE